MAIDISVLVSIDLAPVFDLDPGLSATIEDRINAEIALQGWELADVTDQRAVYIATLATKSFIPRLLLKFAQELKRTKGGRAEAEFNEAIKYLKALQEELNDRIQRAASEACPEDMIREPIAWPGVGPVEW